MRRRIVGYSCWDDFYRSWLRCRKPVGEAECLWGMFGGIT